MLIKWIGGALVVFAGGCIGFTMASRCAARPEHLRQILSAVVSLRSYMSYAASPLSEGLARCAAGTNRLVAGFFLRAAELLRENYTMTPKEAVERALTEYARPLALKKEDCDTLLLFGCNLGSMDKKEQASYLTMIEKRLAILEREAAARRDADSKMYRYLGVCCSLMVVLLLI